jgi:hypothetical protein
MSENILSKLIDHVPTRLVTLESILIFKLKMDLLLDLKEKEIVVLKLILTII